jgi:hypothetical protein
MIYKFCKCKDTEKYRLIILFSASPKISSTDCRDNEKWILYVSNLTKSEIYFFAGKQSLVFLQKKIYFRTILKECHFFDFLNNEFDSKYIKYTTL